MARFLKKKPKANKTERSTKLKKPTIAQNEEIDWPSEDEIEDQEVPQKGISRQQIRKIEAKKNLAEIYSKQKSTISAESSIPDQKNIRELVNEKLTADVIKEIRRSRQQVADRVTLMIRSRQKMACSAINCFALCGEDIVMGTRCCSLIKWNIPTNQVLKIIRRRNNRFLRSEVTAIAVYNNCVVIGCRDGSVVLLEASNLTLLKHFTHRHRGAVTGICFGQNDSFYSSSLDRTIKAWNSTAMSYLHTLYGHEQGVSDISAFSNSEKVVTAGGGDSKVRVWKILEDKQLVFSTSSQDFVDSVAVLDDEHFVSGGTRNCLQLWSMIVAKPIYFVPNAHHHVNVADVWITAVETVRNSDLVASGGNDGFLRLWKVSEDRKSLGVLSAVEIGSAGFVNQIRFSEEMDFVVCVLSREHRLGSWWRLADVDNLLCVSDISINK